MKRIAILGGGISGLTAAYELEQARLAGAPIDWHLFEATDRLGGIIQTTRFDTPEGRYILEGGPDGWVTEKPWATDLCRELGLEDQLIYSNDATRKTYILKNHRLEAIPDSMRLMVPTDLAALDRSPLFSAEAKRAYADELTRSAELKARALDRPGNKHTDESIATFTRRHFGEEVTRTLAAPLLSGVFGGDIEKLSVRAIMPQFVALERDHGSLIVGLQQAAAQRGDKPQPPIFTTLRHGVETLTEALISHLPTDRVHLQQQVWAGEDGGLFLAAGEPWTDRSGAVLRTLRKSPEHDWMREIDQVLLATPADMTVRMLEGPLGIQAAGLLPTDASSAILVCLVWPAQPVTDPRTRPGAPITLPPGFGYLVPSSWQKPVISTGAQRSGENCSSPAGYIQLLATTFVHQKFPHRAPKGAHVLRAFFGGPSADALQHATDKAVAAVALHQLRNIHGPLPDSDPSFTTVRRLPRSLPQYEIGHLDRMAHLDELIGQIPGLHLLGNAYRGVGLPDLIRDARAAARKIVQNAGL